MENAPHNVSVLLAWQDWRDGQWCMEIGPAVTGQRYENGYSSVSYHGSATHWQPRPAPPFPISIDGGVQGSIATKQESCPESAPRTGTADRWPQPGDLMMFLGENGYQAEREVAMKLLDVGASYKVEQCDVGAWHHSIKFEGIDRWFNGVMFSRNVDLSVTSDCSGADTKSDGPDMTMRCCGQHAEDGHHPQCDRSPSDQLTKTPSADHDDGNLRSLSAPNHQPHAVSQDDREFISVGHQYLHFSPFTGHEVWLDKDYYNGHRATVTREIFARRQAPPSPAKTGGVE
jgi:hypothetical protein